MRLAPTFLWGGCSSAEFVNALVPQVNFRLVVDQPYGPGPAQRLDVYLPEPSAEPHEVVIFFHGGSWQFGSKSDYLFLGQAMAARGFVTVIPDYRLYPETRYPGFLQDGAAAVRWTRENIGAFGGDPRRVFLMGHSAGAYIGMMLALDPRWLGRLRGELSGAIGMAGPYDFLPVEEPTLKEIFVGEEDVTRAQPIGYAEAAEVPVLLVSGRSDDTVDPANTARLAARIRECGGQVDERYYRTVGHITIIGAIAHPLQFLAPVLDDVTSFVRDVSEAA